MNNHFFEQKDCGLQAFWSSTPQFKTARVSAHLVLPLTTPENAALYALVHAAQTGGRPADQLSALWCMKLYRRQFCRQTPGQILAPQAVSLLLS